MPSNIIAANGQDLDDIFEFREGRVPRAETGLLVGATDINNRYAKLSDGSGIEYNTSIFSSDGPDLRYAFAKKGSTVETVNFSGIAGPSTIGVMTYFVSSSTTAKNIIININAPGYIYGGLASFWPLSGGFGEFDGITITINNYGVIQGTRSFWNSTPTQSGHAIEIGAGHGGTWIINNYHIICSTGGHGGRGGMSTRESYVNQVVVYQQANGGTGGSGQYYTSYSILVDGDNGNNGVGYLGDGQLIACGNDDGGDRFAGKRGLFNGAAAVDGLGYTTFGSFGPIGGGGGSGGLLGQSGNVGGRGAYFKILAPQGTTWIAPATAPGTAGNAIKTNGENVTVNNYGTIHGTVGV